MTIQILKKGNLRLILNKNRVVKDNPGEDTPAIVEFAPDNKVKACSTYWCAVGEQFLAGTDVYHMEDK